MVLFKINGILFANSTVENGKTKCNFTIPDWSAKNYTITAVYADNNQYIRSQDNAILIIQKQDTKITVNNVTVIPGTKTNFTAIITTMNGTRVTEGIVVIKINGKTIGNTTVINGKVNYEYLIPENFRNSKYTLTMKYAENRKYGQSKENAIITIDKRNAVTNLASVTKHIETITLTSKTAMINGNTAFKINEKIILPKIVYGDSNQIFSKRQNPILAII
ncbi:MAG: hypothetical protein Q4Q23_07180 [Methanobacteriaceae archaeon]|nr:hypothetical protein [Methanobacteriaceae archaeon]